MKDKTLKVATNAPVIETYDNRAYENPTTLDWTIDNLISNEDSVLDIMQEKMKTNGLVVDKIDEGPGTIHGTGDVWAAAFIPGIAFADHDLDKGNYACCTIVNTINKGFRYAAVDKNGNTIDLGPVIAPCIIGNVNRPEGIYIPVSSREAMTEGINYAINMVYAYDDMRNSKRIDSSNKDKNNVSW